MKEFHPMLSKEPSQTEAHRVQNQQQNGNLRARLPDGMEAVFFSGCKAQCKALSLLKTGVPLSLFLVRVAPGRAHC